MIGAVITRIKRTIRLMLSSQYPEQVLFLKLASKLVTGYRRDVLSPAQNPG